jgi:hypothetical protein
MQINDLTFGRVQNVCFALAPRRVPDEKRGPGFGASSA